MFESILNIFRRRKIKKNLSDVPTGVIPMEKISSVNVIIDAEEQGFDELRKDILAWGKKYGLKVRTYFFDFRKLGKEDQLLTDEDSTILKKELDWTGTPDLSKAGSLVSETCDLFISMIDNGNFPIEFISKCARARFKVGRCGFEGHVYDMVMTGRTTEESRPDSRKIFKAITEFLTKIR